MAFRRVYFLQETLPGTQRIESSSFQRPLSLEVTESCETVYAWRHHGLELEDIDYVCNILKAYDQELHSGAKSILDAGECDL